MPVYVRTRGRNFKKRDGRGGEMKTITRDPVAFENMTADELAADHWLEVVKPPASNVKKKRTKKPPKAPSKPKPREAGLSFGEAKTAESLASVKAEELIE